LSPNEHITVILNHDQYLHLIFALGVATGARSDRKAWVTEMLQLMNQICAADPDFVKYEIEDGTTTVRRHYSGT
jgi:hypothetical protein